jgi:hypothetical protein
MVASPVVRGVSDPIPDFFVLPERARPAYCVVMRRSHVAFVCLRAALFASALVACTYPHRDADGGVDAGARPDMGRMDSGPVVDATPPDVGPPDVGSVDAGPPDTNQDVGVDGGYRLYHGWTSPIAGCITAGFNSTTATALGGMYPYNVGDSDACRAWKLAATVCTTEPTMYGDQTNWTCPASGGFTDPMFGTYCVTGMQYSCSTCPGACNAGPMCVNRPLSLRDCSGAEIAQN